MIAWMLYTVLVSACLFVAAAAAEWLFRLRRVPVRMIWITAAFSSVLFAGIALLRPAESPRASADAVDLSALALMQSGMQTVQRAVPASADRLIVAAWVLAACVVMLSFALAYLRLHRARLGWPSIELHGRCVRLSPDVGPIVIGVARPETVVPRWILDRTPDEQRMIVEHEAAHAAARDPLLLVVGCALTALMPWNLALWMLLSRLRLAIELDCDARVLRRGGSPRAYGALLVDVAEHARPLRLASLALSDAASQLQKRILAMEPRRVTRPLLRGAAAALVGCAALLAACEAKVPTSADIARMDASSVERNVKALAPSGRVDSAEVWMVDGKIVSAAEAKAIPSDSIATVNVAGLGGTHAVTMRINTKGYRTIGDTVIYHQGVELRPTADGKGLAEPIAIRGLPTKDQPIFIVDGKRVEASVLHSLNPKQIASINVMKGAAAIGAYGADATNGVIVVQTKP